MYNQKIEKWTQMLYTLFQTFFFKIVLDFRVIIRNPTFVEMIQMALRQLVEKIKIYNG